MLEWVQRGIKTMLKMTLKEKIVWIFMVVFAVVGPLTLTGCVVDSGIGDNAPETEESTPDAGLSDKAYCPGCVTACQQTCYYQRYDEARACTSYTSYSYCVNQCSSTVIPQLEQQCTSQYLAHQACIANSASPRFTCRNNVSVLTNSWTCLTTSLNLASCRAQY